MFRSLGTTPISGKTLSEREGPELSESSGVFSEQLSEFQSVILRLRNPILGVASHDFSNAKTTILGATPGAISGNPHERFSFAPAFSERFFKNWVAKNLALYRIGKWPHKQNKAKIHQKYQKSYFVSIFCIFFAYFEGCRVFLSCRGSSLSQELGWSPHARYVQSIEYAPGHAALNCPLIGASFACPESARRSGSMIGEGRSAWTQGKNPSLSQPIPSSLRGRTFSEGLECPIAAPFLSDNACFEGVWRKSWAKMGRPKFAVPTPPPPHRSNPPIEAL